MFNRASYENSRPDGLAVLEVVGGATAETPRQRLFVPLRRTELSGEVIGPLAALRVTHLYGYTREQCPHVLEAVYRPSPNAPRTPSSTLSSCSASRSAIDCWRCNLYSSLVSGARMPRAAVT